MTKAPSDKDSSDKESGSQETSSADPAVFLAQLQETMEAGAKIFSDIAANAEEGKLGTSTNSSTGTGGMGGGLEDMQKAIVELATSYAHNPDKMLHLQMEFWKSQSNLWAQSINHFIAHHEPDPKHETDSKSDRRFKDHNWQDKQVFDYLKQSYLLAANWTQSIVDEADNVSEHNRKKAKFYAEQLTNAMSPSNFAFTNPEVLELTMQTNGQNLIDGLKQFADDFKDGKIRQTDFSAFEVGRNMGISPGKVVFENDLIQLIQYAPTTPQVYQKPLLIVPPWINKFYILDLNEKKSFIKWAVAQGLTVFIVSWVNPDEKLRDKTFEDYMFEGVLASLDAIEAATGEKSINVIGYCVGGTLVSSTLGYMAEKNDKRIANVTFFTTQVDFEDAGDLLVFVDEEQIAAIEKNMAEVGYMPGSTMATAFNMLRSNDLVWSYVVNNYLKGKQPMAFDLLCWNGDSTNLTEANHSFYLRQCYLENNLSQGKMELGGVKIDLSKVDIPIYNLAAREDHIAPLPSVFKLSKFFSGPLRLVVAGSGHIAGVVNPPAAGKYQYWLNDDNPARLDDWLEGAVEHKGSWWPDWKQWIGERSGKMVKARVPGDGKLTPIEDAPGRFVKVKGK